MKFYNSRYYLYTNKIDLTTLHIESTRVQMTKPDLEIKSQKEAN